jgi:hypothetical protein
MENTVEPHGVETADRFLDPRGFWPLRENHIRHRPDGFRKLVCISFCRAVITGENRLVCVRPFRPRSPSLGLLYSGMPMLLSMVGGYLIAPRSSL